MRGGGREGRGQRGGVKCERGCRFRCLANRLVPPMFSQQRRSWR